MFGVRHFDLPARPNLEYYRKQAKELHRSFEAGEAEVRDRVRDVLGEQSAQRFGLTDAQFVLAQEHGFRSWGDFRRHVEASRTRSQRPVARIGARDEHAYEQQAEALYFELRRGVPEALRRLRAYVPKFADAHDTTGVEQRDARLVIAAELGFPTWRELLVHTAEFQRDTEAVHQEWTRLTPYVAAIRDGDLDRLDAVTVAEADQLLRLLTQPDAFTTRVPTGDEVRLETALGVPRAGMELLIDRARDVDLPLQLAACHNRAEYVELLLAAGARIDSTEIWGITPLESALLHGSAEAADLLAEAGITPWALWTTAGSGRLERVQECYDANGRLRSEAAAHRPDPGNIGMPARLPATDDPAEIESEAFVHACQNGRLAVVTWFLDRGIDPDTCPYYGLTGLHYAISHTRRDVVELLLARGADVDLRDNRYDGDADGWAHHVLGERPDDPEAQAIHDLFAR